jgi:hypothetical protein
VGLFSATKLAAGSPALIGCRRILEPAFRERPGHLHHALRCYSD